MVEGPQGWMGRAQTLAKSGNVGHAALEVARKIELGLVVDLAVRDGPGLLGQVVVSVEEGRVLEDSFDAVVHGQALVGMGRRHVCKGRWPVARVHRVGGKVALPGYGIPVESHRMQ
jgi:hypothetical protein